MSVSFLQKTLSSLFQRPYPRAKLNAGAFFARVKAFLSTFIAFFDGGNCKVVANFSTTFTTFLLRATHSQRDCATRTTLRNLGHLKGVDTSALPQYDNVKALSADNRIQNTDNGLRNTECGGGK